MSIIEGKIESVAFGGEGILRHEGLVVFVPFTAPGDVVSAEILVKKKNFAQAKLLSIHSPSPERTKPQCPYFGTCGGCQLQHLNYAAQVAIKHRFIEDALKRIAKIQVPDFAITPADLQWHYRRHVRLKLQKKDKGFQAGYIGFDNTSFIPIEQCLIFLPTDHSLFLKLQPLLASLPNDGIEEATLRIIKTGDQFLLAFNFFPVLPNATIPESSLWQGMTMQAPNAEKTWGNTMCDTEVLGIKARFSPFGFVQNHPEQSIKLYQAILKELPETAEKILDLYCGIGLTSLLFARLGKKIIGVESHPETIALAQENAQANQLSVDFHEGKAESLGVQFLKTQRPDAVLVNPPRTGLHPALLQALVQEKPACIQYVSCMPSTLARDVQLLVQKGYRVDKIHGFDMFPQTTHVETFIQLVRETA